MKMWSGQHGTSPKSQLTQRTGSSLECDFEEVGLTTEFDKPSPFRVSIHPTLSRGLILDAHREAFSAFLTAIVLTSSAILLLSSLHTLHKSNHETVATEKSLLRLYYKNHNPHGMIQPGEQLAKVIHDTYRVPYRLLEPLSTQNRDKLLTHLRNPSMNTSVSRSVFFVHMNGTDYWERIRAFSNALTFACNTDRVAVIIWRENTRFKKSFDELFSYKDVQVCSPLIVESIKEEEILRLDNIRASSLRNSSTGFDYAELSVRVINDKSSGKPVMSNIDMALVHESAVRDAHLEVTISGSFSSRFSARSDAASILENCVIGRTLLAKLTLSSVHLAVKKAAEYNEQGVFEALHDDFEIPFLLLDGLGPLTARLLLDRLLEEKKMGNPTPRIAWVQPQYGLGNRLRAIGSMWAYARATNRILVVIWVPDFHMNCSFSDLFLGHEDVFLADKMSEAWPFPKARQMDPFMVRSVKWFNYMHTRDGEQRPSSDILEADVTHHVYVSSAYVIQSAETHGIIRTQSPYWRILRELIPHETVARLVERGSIRVEHNTLGVHVRARKLNSDVQGVHFDAYSRESALRTDYWRGLTNHRTFLVEMQRQSKDKMFYVAADMSGTLEVFEREFPGRIIYTPRSCDTRSKNCMQYALADVLLLAKCNNILGSYWSSYTELACRWGGGKYRLAGVDFGKPMSLMK